MDGVSATAKSAALAGAAAAGGDALAAATSGASRWTEERVLTVRHWTPTLVSFRVTRPGGYRFTAGHYARLGLTGADGEPVWRPYSMVSGPRADHLEFLIQQVPNGAFSNRFDGLRPGDPVLVEKASFGFLTLDQLAPGSALWMLASGTGIGPFVSILHGTGAWQAFDMVIVAHSVRHFAQLAYRDAIADLAQTATLAGARARLCYLPIVTREPGVTPLDERIISLLADGRLESSAGVPLEVQASRVMACGNPEMTRELRALLVTRGFKTSRRGAPGQMAFENYW